MNGALRVGYEGAAHLARALSAIAPSSNHKLVETFALRRGVVERFEQFQRDSTRQLLWMHAPSVGEGLQARPVIELAKFHDSALQLAYTYFSPSARAFAATLPVDFQDVLPFDETSDMRRVLKALDPTALVFSKLDVWPTLAREAKARGTRLGLISATMSRGSSRRSSLASALLRDAYARIDRVGAICSDDADRLIALGVPASRVIITGDTRYDQVWARAHRSDAASRPFASLASERPTLVAGSTWPSDEAVLLPAWAKMRARSMDARLIIAPHEPSSSQGDLLARWADGAGLRWARLDDATADADVIIVDRVGVLGDLYALASVAYVGGAFHAAGLHSVLEPAAFGVPVLFGPRYTDSRDAVLLRDEDAALSVSDSNALAIALAQWLISTSDRKSAGDAAARVVHRGLGAAERSYALVKELLR